MLGKLLAKVFGGPSTLEWNIEQYMDDEMADELTRRIMTKIQRDGTGDTLTKEEREYIDRYVSAEARRAVNQINKEKSDNG